MAGDSTGAIFILRMTDVLRVAELERHRRWQETETKRRAALAAKAQAEEAQRAAAEAERKRLESLLIAAKPPIETFEFVGGSTAVVARPSRQMVSHAFRYTSQGHLSTESLPPSCSTRTFQRTEIWHWMFSSHLACAVMSSRWVARPTVCFLHISPRSFLRQIPSVP